MLPNLSCVMMLKLAEYYQHCFTQKYGFVFNIKSVKEFISPNLVVLMPVLGIKAHCPACFSY